ncbi:MAG: radical SAM protein [Phycisphaerae bacterium]|nr:radical SAM protein [Phycisphaerae bacterium]
MSESAYHQFMKRMYRLGARAFLGGGDQGEWIYERIRHPRTILAAVMNLAYFKLKNPRIWSPISVQVEPVYGCNLRCKYCWWGEPETHNNRPRLMDWEVFHSAIDSLPATVESIIFSLMGEPLLHPDIAKMIDYAHRAGRRTIMYTNGTKLTGDRVPMLAGSKLDVVNISIEPDLETARENRGVDLDQIRENVREFKRVKPDRLQIKASCVITENNLDRLAQVREYWSGIVSEFKFAPCLYQTDIPHISTCLEMWRGNFNLLTSGDVTLCCFDPEPELVIGNVRETGVAAMTNGAQMRQLLGAMINGQVPQRCLGCRQFQTTIASPRAHRG